MNQNDIISNFFRLTCGNASIGPMHLSLFLAICKCWTEQEMHSPFFISRSKLMQLARIHSTSTYHLAIADLKASGIIIYEPSYHPKRGTAVKWGVHEIF